MQEGAIVSNGDSTNVPEDFSSTCSAHAKDLFDGSGAGGQFAPDTAKDLKQKLWQEHIDLWLQSK
jgi:hypothetical protein